jgi:tRNA(fMet)-specific endonuclease VapC
MERQQLLIDTSILIDHLRKQRKDQTLFYRATFEHECRISAITEFEFRVGSTPKNYKFIEEILEDVPVLPFDSACVQAATDLYQELKGNNQLLALPDVFIAATAIVHQIPLLTLNRKHFERIGRLRLLDFS